MNILILADKYPKRMKSKGCVGLIKINNKHIITQQYNTLKAIFPDSKIIYVYGFDGKRLLSHIYKNNNTYKDIELVYNKNYEIYNSTYSVSLAQEFLQDETMILFGDNIVKSNVFNSFNKSNGSQVFINNKHKTKLGCIINNQHIENIAYDLENYLSEIYFISKSHIDTFKNLVNNSIYHNHFMFEILNKMIDMNHDIRPHFITYKPLLLNRSL